MDAMEKFGKYVLVKLIAMGGMAEVFLAKEFGISGFQRILAIKRVLPHLAQDHEFIEMFTGEARLSAQLTHPNIVQIYEFGIIDESYYLAMEYIDGLTLSDLLSRYAWKKQVLPLELTLLIIAELCQGLEYAHNKRSLNNEPLNIVHRDISPKNAMLSYDGAVKLMDFGIAKAADQQRQETISGTIKGKISYLSPEQVMGQKLDRRSDLFSLGVVFWEMLTSQRCFTGDNEFAILYKIRMAEVAPPSSFNRAVPKELDAIVLKVLKLDREERHQSAEELHNELNQFRYKHGLLASTSKLAGFLRDLKSADEEDTLSALQRIDWQQVEAEFGMGATASLRADLDTPVSETAPLEPVSRTKTPGKGLKALPEAEGSASERSGKAAQPTARTPGKDTSKRIRSAQGSAKAPSEQKKPRPPAERLEEDELAGADAFEDGPEPSHLVPVLLAFSVALLLVSALTFAYVLWPRIVGPEPEPQPTPTARSEATPVPTLGELAATPEPAAATPIPPVLASPAPATAAPVESTPSPTPAQPTRRPTPPPPEPTQRPSPRAATPAGPAVAAPTPQPTPQPPAPSPTPQRPPAPSPTPQRPPAPSPTPQPPQPTPTEPEPPKARGLVLVSAAVPVELYLGGESLGRTGPGGLRLQLQPGTHQILALGYVPSPPTFYRAEFSLAVPAGENVSHAIRFPELGSLNVTSARPATLFVDGVRIDLTPIPKLNITAGMHELRFEFKSGEVSRQRYQVRAGQYATVFGKL